MSTMAIEKRIVTISNMNVAGSKLPKDFSVKLNLVIDFTDATDKQVLLVCASGSSARVRAQTKLRAKGAEWLRAHAGKLVRMTLAEILTPAEETVADKLALLSREELYNELKGYGVSREAADRMYDRKHGLAIEDEEDESEEENEEENEE